MLSRYGKWRVAQASKAIRLRFKVSLVEKVSLFAGLSARELHQIARLVNELELPAGTRLATAGEPGGEMFIIVAGEAAVRTPSGRTAVLGAGDFFGEMSLLDAEPRSATVDAATPMRLLVLGERDFWHVLNETPSIVRKVMQTLSRRVRQAEASTPE